MNQSRNDSSSGPTKIRPMLLPKVVISGAWGNSSRGSSSYHDNPSDKDINQGTLVVFNLDPSVSNEDLRQIFGAYGEVKEVIRTYAVKKACLTGFLMDIFGALLRSTSSFCSISISCCLLMVSESDLTTRATGAVVVTFMFMLDIIEKRLQFHGLPEVVQSSRKGISPSRGCKFMEFSF
ncbi:hypothetical protein ACFE04_023910 [Oxalis oulophora]